MHFLLTTLKVVYVLTTPMPELLEDDTVEAIRRRAKWENGDYICRGHILNEDASSKKFLVSNFNNYKMVDSRPVMEQFNELFIILGQYTQHDDLSLVQLGSHLRIEESLKAHESDKAKEKKLLDPRDCRSGNKKNNASASYLGKGSKDQSQDQGRVRLSDPKKKSLGEKGIDCIFVGYAEHSKAYRFYVIEPNDSISINSIIELRDLIFDENRFSSIPKPNDIIPNSDESQKDDHSNDVPSETLKPRKDVASWKEAIGDEIGSIMENNTRVLSDLPPGFRQKEGIDYFDTYAPVARITTISFVDKI
ncbi:hypothetical protein Tco_0500098 [Tanacetum coccineum]